MKVQAIVTPNSNNKSWMVIDNNYLPIQPIESFISYLETCGRSPNTVKNYAHDLKTYWEYLSERELKWTQVKFGDLQRFVCWLEQPEAEVLSIQPQKTRRSRRTINRILSSIYAFYRYQECLGVVGELPLYRYVREPRKYKPFLHGIGKSKPVKKKRLKLKEPETKLQTVTPEQVNQLTDACQSIRDKFLIQLLYQTGIRIGAALGLRHSDINTIGKEIQVVPREDNLNGARAKFDHVHKLTAISKGLIRLYLDYLSYELKGIDSDYVFVNISKGQIGKPMSYSSVLSLFKRLSKKVGFHIHPHMLRHTHATELLRAGFAPEWVQKRLGHTSVQTTINIYAHLSDEDLREKIESFNQHNIETEF